MSPESRHAPPTRANLFGPRQKCGRGQRLPGAGPLPSPEDLLSARCQTTWISMVEVAVKRSEPEESNPILTLLSRSQIRVMP
jgi:hypothetical protein